MLLVTYLEKYRLTQRDFAKRIKVSSKTIWSICHGTDIRLSIAMKIVRETRGEVAFKDLLKTRRKKKTFTAPEPLPLLDNLEEGKQDEQHHADSEKQQENVCVN